MLHSSFPRGPVGNGLDNRPEDVRAVRALFARIGRLAPGKDDPQFFDAPLEQAITAFQRENRLLEDGVMRPGGETERNVKRSLGLLPDEPHLSLAELAIRGPVGNGLDNDPHDLRAVSKALGRLGRFAFDKTAEPPAYISRELDEAIHVYQRDRGLNTDGVVTPGGETIQALAAEVSPKPARRVAARQTVAGPDAATDAGAAGSSADARKEAGDFYDSRGPLGADGKPRPPHPNDPRFDADGRPRGDWFTGEPKIDATLLWSLENTGINPKTEKFDYYGNMGGFRRDPKTGRWEEVRNAGPNLPPESSAPRLVKPPPVPPNDRERRRNPRSIWIWGLKLGKWVMDSFGKRDEGER